MIKTQRLYTTTFAFCALTLLLSSRPTLAGDASFAVAAEVIQTRCMPCHDSETRVGEIDLTPLLQQDHSTYGKYTKLWVKLESKVARGEMPPSGEEPLTLTEKEAITSWFEASFVLREGKPHIGRTPLRRLTRYEFENTLEEVLSINLKIPYRDVITERIEVSQIESIVPSDLPGESGFDNDAVYMEQLKPPLKDLATAVHYALSVFSKDPSARNTVLGVVDIPMDGADAEIRQVISKFLTRAYRGSREKLEAHTDVYYNLFQKHVQISSDTNASLLYTLEMILLSPEFLFRFEESKNLDTPYPVTGLELATRLSYFLWSTAPDAELLQHARDGSLLKDDVLKSQVARMLNSPKRIALSENFAGQWLGFDDLLTNREYLSSERWNRETYDEILFFVDELIKSDRSLLELIQSDWVYKKPSARGYQKIDPESVQNLYANIFANRQSNTENERARYEPPVLVKTRDEWEGGVITSPAIMRLTSSKDRTSPIRRGVWVLSTIIGKDLEPPPDVPLIEEAVEALQLKENPSVAEVLKQHVSKSECIICHKAIDPLGLGLENFAPTGEWRKLYPDQLPIESAGVMPNGKGFRNPGEMKILLLEMYEDDIVNNFVEQLFAYALGRKSEPFDRFALQRILREVKDDGYKINTVIEQIVLSKQFRYRQDR